MGDGPKWVNAVCGILGAIDSLCFRGNRASGCGVTGDIRQRTPWLPFFGNAETPPSREREDRWEFWVQKTVTSRGHLKGIIPFYHFSHGCDRNIYVAIGVSHNTTSVLPHPSYHHHHHHPSQSNQSRHPKRFFSPQDIVSSSSSSPLFFDAPPALLLLHVPVG